MSIFSISVSQAQKEYGNLKANEHNKNFLRRATGDKGEEPTVFLYKAMVQNLLNVIFGQT